MIKTYKREFTVAKWSEVKTQITLKSSFFDDLRHWQGFYHKTQFLFMINSYFGEDLRSISDFMIDRKIDFINFDE